MDKKKCLMCKRRLLLEKFYKHRGRKDGLSSYCGKCISRRVREYYAANTERMRWESVQKWKNDLEYHKKKMKMVTRYRNENRDLINKRARDRYKNNSEYRAKRIAVGKIWHRNNPDKSLLIGRRYEHKKRAMIIKGGGSWTVGQWNLVLGFYCPSGKCLGCGKSTKMEADHIIPVFLGGTSLITNIQPLCRSCNASKHTKATDYRPDKGAFARTL